MLDRLGEGGLRRSSSLTHETFARTKARLGRLGIVRKDSAKLDQIWGMRRYLTSGRQVERPV